MKEYTHYHKYIYTRNLPLKYTFWIGAIGVHLVGRCVLYSYRFLDPLIRWIATGNGWNLRQPAWLKSNDMKSLQSWASRTHRASGCWGGSMKSVKAPSGKVWNNRENIRQRNLAFQDICWIWKCYRLRRLWSCTQHSPRHQRPIALLRCSNKNWTNIRWTTTIVCNVSAKH